MRNTDHLYEEDKEYGLKFYIFLTVHLRTILVSDQLDTQSLL